MTSAADRAEVAAALGREPAGKYKVAVRNANGKPSVIANAPFLNDGTPMPTRYWLVDPEIRRAVSRLEAAGGIQRVRQEVDPAAIAKAHQQYAIERDMEVPPSYQGHRPSGGVGGTEQGVKCLHAHLAWWLAGGADPVGEWAAAILGVPRSSPTGPRELCQDAPGARVCKPLGRPPEIVRSVAARERRRTAVAAIDCGTNSTRLLIVDDQGRSQLRLMNVTRLGQGLDRKRRLSSEAIFRTVATLSEFRQQIERFGVDHARVVATAAVRDSANAGEFVAAATKATGIEVQVLSAEDEGKYAYKGAIASLKDTDGSERVLDIGGGSTEIVSKQASDIDVVSLKIGSVCLTERHLLHDPPTPNEIALAIASIRSELPGYQFTPGGLHRAPPTRRLLGLAGTISTLSALVNDLDAYNSKSIHHSVIHYSDVVTWCETLLQERAIDRAERHGMLRGREDVIIGGVLILREVMAHFGHDQCLVSESDLLDGITASLLYSERTGPS